MESFSIRADCPYPGELLDELWPKLADYCAYDVFEYASGKVTTVAFEKYYSRIKSHLLMAMTMDFTEPGACQIDIIAGGGPEGTVDFAFSAEKSAVSDVIQMLTDICDAKGWSIREDDSEHIEDSPEKDR